MRNLATLVVSRVADWLIEPLFYRDPSQFQLFEPKFEVFICRIRILGAVLTAVLLPFLPLQNRAALYLLIGVAIAYSVLILQLVERRSALLRRGYLPFALDTVAIDLAVILTGGIASEFFACLYASITLYAVRFGWKQSIVAASMSVAAYLGAMLLGTGTGREPDVALLAFRSLWLGMFALGAGFLGEVIRAASAALRSELLHTRSLLRAAHAPTTSLSVEGVVQAVLEQSCSLTEADAGTVQIDKQDGHRALFREKLDDTEAGRTFGRLMRGNLRARAALVASARPLTPAEIAEHAGPLPPTLYQFSSLCAVPISTEQGRLGFVAVAMRNGGGFQPHHFDALCAFVDRAALAVQNSRLYEQVQAQVEELRSLHAQVIRSERLAAVGELAAKVAHELNNPLASIDLYNSLLLESTADPAEQRRLATQVLEQVERAKRVVRDILDFTRAAEPHLVATDLNTVVEQSLGLVRHAARAAGVSLIEDYAPGLPNVKADRNQIAQIVTNLTLNAVQAMPSGGTLTVSTVQDHQEVCLIFRDTGTGIGPEHLEHIFDPFFTTKPFGQGTGLGLAVCRTLVAQHRGEITVASEPGKGSTFSVYLPVAPIKEALVAG